MCVLQNARGRGFDELMFFSPLFLFISIERSQKQLHFRLYQDRCFENTSHQGHKKKQRLFLTILLSLKRKI